MNTINFKKLLLLFVFSFTLLDLFGQHISFLGIPMGQSESVFDKKLRQKGFVYKGINNVFETRMYDGTFWNYRNTRINVEYENGKATSVNVGPNEKIYNSISEFNKLVSSLDKKYGKHHPKENLFTHFLFYLGTGYYWKVTGGYIVASRISTDDPSKIMIMIYYLDNTSHYVIYELGQRRNTSNDL